MVMMITTMNDDDDNSNGDTSSNDDYGTIWKKVAAQGPFSRTFLRPRNLNNLAPTFKIIGPTSVFAFSRYTGVAARCLNQGQLRGPQYGKIPVR